MTKEEIDKLIEKLKRKRAEAGDNAEIDIDDVIEEIEDEEITE